MTSFGPQPTRRRVLTATGSLTFTGVLGGCTLLEGPQAISGVTLKSTELVIQLSSDADVTALTLVGPDGKAQDAARLMPGITTVTFELTGDEPPGEYRLVANNGNETIDERRLTLTKTMELTNVQVVNQASKSPRGLLLSIKSTGDLPLNISDETFKVKGSPYWIDDGFHAIRLPDSEYRGLLPSQTTEDYILYDVLFHRPQKSSTRPQSRCSGTSYTLTVRCNFGEVVSHTYEISIKEQGESIPDRFEQTNYYSCSKATVIRVTQAHSSTEDSSS
jgi:hypothetical protein